MGLAQAGLIRLTVLVNSKSRSALLRRAYKIRSKWLSTFCILSKCSRSRSPRSGSSMSCRISTKWSSITWRRGKVCSTLQDWPRDCTIGVWKKWSLILTSWKVGSPNWSKNILETWRKRTSWFFYRQRKWKASVTWQNPFIKPNLPSLT